MKLLSTIETCSLFACGVYYIHQTKLSRAKTEIALLLVYFLDRTDIIDVDTLMSWSGANAI